MARIGRSYPDNCVVHIINRGVERRRLFANDRDYARFRGLLGRVRAKIPMRLLAYALMPNHWHLVAWPTSPAQLSQFMHRLTFIHAADLRHRTESIGLGHVYQGRYRAFALQSPARYLAALRYVEGNPVRAGLVDSAELWRWSSTRERVRGGRRRIDDGPIQLPPPDDWLKIVNRGLSCDELNDLRGQR